jgi:mycothiol synthase
VTQLTEAEQAEVDALLDAARRADDHAPLAEHKMLDLAHAGRDRPGFAGFLLRSGGALDGYAQLSGGEGSWGAEAVVHPDRRSEEKAISVALVSEVLREVERRGGGHVHYWMSDPSPARMAGAVALGFEPGRELLQMRVDLPLPSDGDTAPPPGLRPFRPGADEAAWLEVNHQAFADHPEQGRWERSTLLDREAEAWFDPNGFLLSEEDGRLLGSCWTKVHRTDPPMGEIYVISVAPHAQHRGLGRALTVAGLRWLASQGLRLGMLYVDGANEAAVSLYRSLGFTVDHADRAYALEVAAGDGSEA